jgi:23S rRNA-/tRNA-specific pseudouridylate synthase
VVRITIPPPADFFDAATVPLKVVLDDGAILVLNKQPRLPVQPRHPLDFNNVLSALHVGEPCYAPMIPAVLWHA